MTKARQQGVTRDTAVTDLIDSEMQSQRDTLRMIASENYTSSAVLGCLASPLSNRYAEGYPGKRYYQGQTHIDALETLTIDRAKKLFNAEHANVQPLSGAPANLAAYIAFCKPGDRIVGLGLNSGGHLTHGWRVNATGIYYKAHQFEVERDSERFDVDRFAAFCAEVKPAMVMIGTTSYPRQLDWEGIAAAAHKSGAIFVADIAHVAGLIAGGAYDSPVPYADAVTMTTHKTLRGPRGGMILSKAEHASKIDRAVFPALQGGPHINQMAALAVALGEAATPAFKMYAQNCVANARALGDALVVAGLRLTTGGTDSHLLVADLTPLDIVGSDAAKALEKAGIICNANAIPYDPRPPKYPSGLRFGTPALTTRGLMPTDMSQIASWIMRVLKNSDNQGVQKEVAGEIKAFLAQFPIDF